MKALLRDDFSHPRPHGQVIGTMANGGYQRLGVDAESIMAIDNNALRISSMIQPGWNRAALAYGPYERKNGLLYSSLILNAHNTSQADALSDSFPRRIGRWLLGANTEKTALLPRALAWLVAGDKAAFIQKMRWWWYISRATLPELYDNLAFGCFDTSRSEDPRTKGSAMFMHATGEDTGELHIQTGYGLVPVLRGVYNIPLYYAMLLREEGAVYYLASLPSANRLSAFPQFRPIGIDSRSNEKAFYPTIQQSVQGQIGFRAETRVHNVQLDEIKRLNTWYGTAHCADKLSGDGDLGSSNAEIGGSWQSKQGQFSRSNNGLFNNAENSLALIDPQAPSGLIHLRFTVVQTEALDLSLLWRAKDEQAAWRIHLKGTIAHLELQGNLIAQCEIRYESVNSLQILDDGEEIRIILNNHLLFLQKDSRLAENTALGLQMLGRCEDSLLSHFEAHPRFVEFPIDFAATMPQIPSAKQVLLHDDFAGEAGDFDGRRLGTKIWKKHEGKGRFEIDGNGQLKVCASVEKPNAGRTSYIIGWDNPIFAELESEILPPGTERGQKEAGRGSFIFMENPQRYLIVGTWLDDYYDGTSISSFFQLNAFEELYDAVWTNIGRRITWGKPYRLRASFDGLTYIVWVDDVPVLYRSLTDIYPKAKPLHIRSVGLVANWEWGNDTGSIFRNFTARI